MDDKLYQDDFEELLQDHVKNQRMYPSDAVWRNINKELHGDNHWPALTISAFLLLITTVAVCIHFSPKPNIFAIPSGYQSTPSAKNQLADLSTPSFLNSTNKNLRNSIAPLQADNTLRVAASSATPVIKLSQQRMSRNVSSPVSLVSRTSSYVISINRNVANTPSLNEMELSPLTENQNEAISKAPSVASTNESHINAFQSERPAPVKKDLSTVDNFLNEHSKDLSLYTTTQAKNLKNHFSYQVYLAPSVSYRKLKEDRTALQDNNSIGGPVALNYVTDVNKVVRHKPGTGLEAGLGVVYNLSNKFRLKTGLQFNVRQYNIEAFRAAGERTSIALITANRVDTIYSSSVYRTNNGYVSAELVNRYYQVAIPVGLEWEVIGNKNVQLNIAGTIQPTYLLNKSAYLLSSNYKNYTASRGMVNSWNLNSNIEAFISFKTRNYKLQLGPQLRYQHFSTFISPYPIKEHLLDYGFKLGVSKIIF